MATPINVWRSVWRSISRPAHDAKVCKLTEPATFRANVAQSRSQMPTAGCVMTMLHCLRAALSDAMHGERGHRLGPAAELNPWQRLGLCALCLVQHDFFVPTPNA